MFDKFMNFVFGTPNNTADDEYTRKRLILLASKNSDASLYKDTLNYALCFPEVRRLNTRQLLDSEEYRFMLVYEKIEELRKEFPEQIAEAERLSVEKQMRS